MRRIFRNVLFFVCLVAPFFLATGIRAQEEQITTEQITLFNVTVELEQNTDINIREEIHYFFPTPRRGIIREIPTDYKVQAGFRRPTTLVLNNIFYYEKGNPQQRFSDYERSRRSGYAIFRIGQPDVTIRGEYVYVIEYTLRSAINYFDDYDELYLNITGDGWDVPIKEARAEINVPGEITDRICFTGPAGSILSNCSFETVSDEEVKVSADSELSAFEGLTVTLKMPKGTLEDTTARQRIAFLISNIGLLLPVPVFFLVSKVVKKKGKNRKLTVIRHFEPAKGLYPLLAGYVYNAKLDSKHITAQIIQLAIDGHIKIKQEKKNDYLLQKIENEKEIKDEATEVLYSGIFKKEDSINTKKFPTNFYLTVRDIEKKLNSKLYSKKYFDKDRKKLKSSLSTFGVIGLFVAFISFTPLSYMAAVGWSIGILLSSIVLFIFSSRVDLRGEKGNEIYHELEGLKAYIDTAEKDRIEFHNDPKKFRGVFETLLPYAIIFGLERKWAGKFKDLYKEPPNWYEGNMTAFNTYVLASSFTRMNRNVKARSVAPNSAGGFRSSHGAGGGSGFSGGMSGGGFGGGGGSSW